MRLFQWGRQNVPEINVIALMVVCDRADDSEIRMFNITHFFITVKSITVLE